MHCPFCDAQETKVIDSRLVDGGAKIKRRRECLRCHERFTTFEEAALSLPRVVKSSEERQSFDEKKLQAGLLKALEKRSVSMAEVEAMVGRIKHRLRSSGDAEVSAQLIGEYVMDELRKTDDVAYVRFASVYRRFEDIEDFGEEIQRLRAGKQSTSPR